MQFLVQCIKKWNHSKVAWFEKKKYITFASNNKDNFEIPFQLFFDFLMRKLKNTVGYKLIARAIAQFIWNSRSLELLSDTYFSFEFVLDYLKTMVIRMFQHFILEEAKALLLLKLALQISQPYIYYPKKVFGFMYQKWEVGRIIYMKLPTIAIPRDAGYLSIQCRKTLV